MERTAGTPTTGVDAQVARSRISSMVDRTGLGGAEQDDWTGDQWCRLLGIAVEPHWEGWGDKTTLSEFYWRMHQLEQVKVTIIDMESFVNGY